MWLLIIAIIYLVISVDILLAYKYKVMHKTKYKHLWSLLHLLILLTNLVLFLKLLEIEFFRVHLIAKVIMVGIIFLGFLAVVWSVIHLKKQILLSGHKLIKTGPFKYSRNPIYTADIVMAMAAAILYGSLEAVIYSLVLVPVFYYLIKQEEKEILMRFREYERYMDEVPRFF